MERVVTRALGSGDGAAEYVGDDYVAAWSQVKRNGDKLRYRNGNKLKE